MARKDKEAFRIKRILYAGVTLLGSKAIQLILLVISVPLTYNYLGDERFGILMTIMSIVSILNFADLGLGLGLLNIIPELALEDSLNRLKSAISSTFFFLCAISTLGLISTVFIFPYISWDTILNVSITSSLEINLTILVFFLCFFVTLPFTLVTRIQGGFQEYHNNNYWDAAGSVFSLICLLVTVRLKLGIHFILLALYGAKCLFIILNFLNLFLIKRKKLIPNIYLFDFTVFKIIFKEGMFFFIIQISAMLTFAFDNLIITRLYGASSVALFAIGYRLFSILMTPTQAFVGPMLPAFNDAIANNNFTWLKKLTKRSFALVLGSSIFASLIYYWFGNAIIRFWISSETQLSTELLIAFSLYIIYFNVSFFVTSFMYSRPMLQRTIFIFPFVAIICFVLKLFLPEAIGISGIIWSNTIVITLFWSVPSFYYFFRFLNKSSETK